VTITWDPPAGQSPVNYTIFRDDVSIGTATGTSFIDENPGLVPLTNQYQVRSNGGTGENARPNSVRSDPVTPIELTPS
jgi:hypothetical protein